MTLTLKALNLRGKQPRGRAVSKKPKGGWKVTCPTCGKSWKSHCVDHENAEGDACPYCIEKKNGGNHKHELFLIEVIATGRLISRRTVDLRIYLEKGTVRIEKLRLKKHGWTIKETFPKNQVRILL
jgi:hypothetical protein